MEYVKIRSWHRVSLVSRASWNITFCGRVVKPPTEIRHELPLNERTCESCLRISERQQEKRDRLNVG